MLRDWLLSHEEYRHQEALYFINSGWSEFLCFVMLIIVALMLGSLVRSDWRRWWK